jgi:hypothetical protein
MNQQCVSRSRLATLVLALSLWAFTGRAAVNLPPGVSLRSAVFGAGTFVAVGDAGTIYSSAAGGDWLPRNSGLTNRLETVTYGGGLFLAVGANGAISTSPDGVTWTPRSVTVEQTSPQAAYGNGVFVIGGKGGPGLWTMLVSSNAVNWRAVSIDAPAPSNAPDGMPFNGVAFNAGKFVAIGGTDGGVRLFLGSTNGVIWKELTTEGTSVDSRGYKALVSGQGRFGVLEEFYYYDDDDDAGVYGRLLTSSDGLSWQPFGPESRAWEAVALGDCRIVFGAPYPNGNVSYDLNSGFYDWSWEYFSTSPLSELNSIVFGDHKFFAVGSDIVELPGLPSATNLTISPPGLTNSLSPYPPYVRLSARVPCFDVPVRLQWFQDGVPLPGETNISINFYPGAEDDSGEYIVVATAGNVSYTSAVARVSFLPGEPRHPHPPAITFPSSPTTNVFSLGADASLSVVYLGWPNPDLQWLKNGVALPGETDSTLTFRNAHPGLDGVYTVLASNASGMATSVTMTVRVEQQVPVSWMGTNTLAVTEGAGLILRPAFSYYPATAQTDLHIFRNGVAERLPLSPNRGIVINHVSLADAGMHLFVASNSAGVFTAGVVNVSVTPAGPLDQWRRVHPAPQNEVLYDVSYGNGRFIGVGENGTLVHSTNGIHWSATRMRGDALISGITFGNGQFVAVGGANILSSTTGIGWSPAVGWTELELQSVIFANGRFVAVGGDSILTSADGLNWAHAIVASGDYRRVMDVAYGNGVFVAVGHDIEGRNVFVSTNGTHWQDVARVPAHIDALTFANNVFVAVGDDGAVYTSADGLNWTERDSTVSQRLRGVAYGNGTFVAVGSRGRIVRSANGITWSRSTSSTPDRLESVRFLNNLFVAVGENGTTLTSPDGITWTRRNQGSTRDLDGMVQGAGQIVVVGKGGTILTSSDGANFTQQNSGTTNDLHGIGYADGLFIAVGEPEIILTSPNGTAWTVRHSSTNSSLKNVHRGSAGWIAVGTEGTILHSPDGLTWSRIESPTCNDLNDVSYGHGQYVIVGDQLPPNGTMLVSSDGVNWQRRHQYIGKNLRSVEFVNGVFLATANDGFFLVSSNGLNWGVGTLDEDFAGSYYEWPRNLRAAGYAEGTWTMVGNEGRIYTSTNLVLWTQRPAYTRENLHGVAFLNGRFVTIGNRGTILRSDSTIVTSLLGRATPAGFELTVRGEIGATYELQAVEQLGLSWAPLRTFTLGQSTTNLLDPGSASQAQRFYRLRRVP